jgi:NMT1-like family
MSQERKGILATVVKPFMEIFGLSRLVAFITVFALAAIVLLAVFWFFHSAPPSEITITSGVAGSSFETNAFRYAQILARSGVKVHVLPSEGSLQNLQRLEDPEFKVDLGFVQGGVSNGPSRVKLMSLGSVNYQPLLVFYRGDPIALLSALRGKRLAIGAEGSGTHSLALTLLRLNEITPGDGTVFKEIEAGEAARALLETNVDAVFLMGDSASPQVMRQLLRAPDIQLYNFTQADAYCRRVSYLNRLQLPMGSIDFGKNLPAHDIELVAPTVELLARPRLHPALVDLLIEVAQEVHGGASLLKKKGEFPAPLEHEYKLSAEAVRYYKTGKSFLYRWLPFRFASLVNRVLVAFVPLVVLMIPALKLLPTVLGLRVKLRIYRWYRVLLALDRELHVAPPDKCPELLAQLEELNRQVNRMKVPASFADQFYALRSSINFVRERIVASQKQVSTSAPQDRSGPTTR